MSDTVDEAAWNPGSGAGTGASADEGAGIEAASSIVLNIFPNCKGPCRLSKSSTDWNN